MEQRPLTIQKNSYMAWFLATRPKTLAPSLAPILAATSLAYADGGIVRWDLSLFALLAALCIHIGTNFINDSQDARHSKDTRMRLGPMRMSQAGFLSPKKVYIAGVFCFMCGLIFGVPLIIQGGSPIFFALVTSILAGYLYTGGPYPLGYHGFGDLFVMLFFGWVITGSIYEVQRGFLSFESWLLGTQMGLLATSLFAMTSFRDIVEDTATQKRTLAVRFGPTFARWEITATAFLPYLLNLYWLTQQKWIPSLLPFLTLPLAIQYVYQVWCQPPSRLYIKLIGTACVLQFFFGLLLAIAFVLS